MSVHQSASELRTQRKMLRLSETEYQYLKYSKVPLGYIENGTVRTDKLDNQVMERLELLPQRFEILFEDIELLAERGSQQTGDKLSNAWIGCWLRLLDLEIEVPLSEDDLIAQLTYRKTGLKSAPEEWGKKIGTMIWALFNLNPPGADRDEILQNIIWGIIGGVATSSVGEPNELGEIKLQMAKEFQKRAQLEVEIEENFFSRTVQTPDEERVQEIYDRIVELLKAEVTDLDSWLGPDSSSKTDQKKLDDVARPWIVHRVAKLVGDEVPSMEYWIYGADVDGWSPDDNITSELISELVGEHRLVEKQRLLGLLDEDTKRIEEKIGKGPTASQILNIVAAEDHSVSSKEVANKINENKHWTGGVTDLGRDLAAHRDPSEYPERDIWSERPVLKGSNAGWEITAYGKALYYSLKIDVRGSNNPSMVLPQEMFEAAHDEVVTS